MPPLVDNEALADQRLAELLARLDSGEVVDTDLTGLSTGERDRLRAAFVGVKMLALARPGQTDSPAAETAVGELLRQDAVTRHGLERLAGHSLPLIPGFELHRLLGRGGMGAVYLARHVRLGRLVALKTLPTGAITPDRLSRLRAEAGHAARLNHPNVVQVYEVGEIDGIPYLVTEYVHGRTLAEYARGRTVLARDAAQLIEKVARGVGAAHTNGIIHRDLKPSNILLHDEREPKVVDFGLAKDQAEAAGLTQTGQLLGTPQYMAPEQATGIDGVGPPADVHALGIILYELLTGRSPFAASTPAEAVIRVRHFDPVRPRLLDPSIPKDLENICLRCLEKSPVRRYPTATELADDLARFLNHQPVVARPVGLVRRLAMWARRRPATAAALTVAVAATVLLVAAFITFTVRLADERDTARRERDRASANYSLAKTVVDDLLTEANAERGDDEDAEPARLPAWRRRLLEKSRHYLREFIAQSGDDWSQRIEIADAHVRLAVISQRLGSNDETREALRSAVELYTRAVADGGDDECERQRATCLRKLAMTHRQLKEYDAAAQFLRQAVDAVEDRAGEPWRFIAMLTHAEAGALAWDTRDDETAARQFLAAIRIAEELRAGDATNPDYLGQLGSYHDRLSNVYSRSRDPAQALRHCELGYLFRVEAARRTPDRAFALGSAGLSAANYGQKLNAAGRTAEGERLRKEARQWLEEATRRSPEYYRLRTILAAVYRSQARDFHKKHDAATAIDLARRALDHTEYAVRIDPRDRQNQNGLRASLRLIGEMIRSSPSPKEAEDLLRRSAGLIEALADDHPAFRFDFGAFASLVSDYYQDVDQTAEAWLWSEKAVKALTNLPADDPHREAAAALLEKIVQYQKN